MERTVRIIAESVGGTVEGDGDTPIRGVDSLDRAGDGHVSFYFDPRYREALLGTKASALIVSEVTEFFEGPQILVPNPELAYARIAALFAPPVPTHPGISERAVVHGSCRLGAGVSIYPMVYVGRDAEIGDHTVLFPGVYIGDRVTIGARSVLYPNVTVMGGCIIGNDVIIHAGTVIGSDGFGYVRDGATSVKIPQTGIVQIDDHVEIGALNTIDRAALGRTWIRRGVKTDNLVQVAHNVVIGEDTIVVAQTGISGSVRVGRQVILGGQVGISDHLEIGDRAMVGSQSGVAKNVEEGEVVSGTPAIPHRQWLRSSLLTARLPDVNGRLKRLEKRLNDLESDRADDRARTPTDQGG